MMKKTVRVLVVAVVIAAINLVNARPAQAQAGVVVENARASVRFGEGITFLASIQSSIQIQSAAIVIFDMAQGITRVQPITINQDGTAESFFDTRQNILRPFTMVRWSYQFTLVDGSAAQSESYFVRYDDDRFQWQTLETGALRVSVHWYNGDANFGGAALNAAGSGMQSIERLTPLDLAQPVDIFIYANANDLRGTLYLNDDWVAGHTNAALGVVMVTIEPGTDQSLTMERRIPHELMHVMLYRRVGAGYNNIPTWLNEGMATLAEINPNPDYDTVLMDRANKNSLIPIRDLCASFSPNSESAFLAYAESRSFTNYLHNKYGSNKLLSLALAYADGLDCERGVESTLGVSLSKLESDWRESVLGQNAIGVTFKNSSPYLVLLCLVLFIPFIGVLSSMRRKESRNEQRNNVR